MSLLKTEHIGMTFGGLKAVSDFSIEIKENELVGLIGPNGAGKTTIFNMLTGVYAPTEGKVYLGETVVNGKKPYQIVNLGLGRTFQNIRLFKELSVIDNIKIAFHKDMSYSTISAVFRGKKFWKEEKEIDIKARELLGLFNMEEDASVLSSNLPYGKQRKLEICRALATNPKLLLLDEPAAGMNPQETKELMETIAFIREKFKVSILLIEHDMSLVMGICERIVVIDYGRMIAAGTPAEIKSNEKVIGAYLGQ
ncbi:leucine/isoleucine/valine transporter subunit; ATP-binding component of ABC superfamily [Petrocella atlantisensis]|uniref:Leucine/isoleucine/valine transporter subunit ATP-binding component of ABC superfamily n=1 Tax=Petrocella atlantisensis TaxID=2173034 RepID=A0A3P7PDD5_9FIRM|nr:ABC transporter ATP-binding protein [Petrocella atlantisensis]MCF8018547.1 ABC transporter ATP-binding protein [Vallitaleaceae bacterium]PKM54548.1 MAG: ABC transporter ATP-binding protein [Firmicutes bacterium HGW-Firmicutes-5]VDN48073.1 leucine/isoleucine/valine transporter subunit; ATP-binding component of ABC superfamily [Petrocella atlantisensis]